MKLIKGNFPYVIIAIILVGLFGVWYINSQTRPPKNQQIAVASPSDIIPELPKKIKVYITGEVDIPGVYELDEKSRVEDLILAAGGSLESADLLRVNLAALLKDAQHVHIPAVGETIDISSDLGQNDEGGKVNINTADLEGLKRIPGVGEVTAQNIIKYRESEGPFKTIEDIMNVTRIGEKTFESIKDYICID